MKKVGVVTVTYNAEPLIPEYMESLVNQDYPNFSLYISDNGSTDKTLDEINKYYLKNSPVIIRNEYNTGAAIGNNQAIKKAMEDDCDYILMVNADVKFEPSLISKLVQAAVKTGYSVIAPKMMYYADPKIIWFAGGYFKKNMGYDAYHAGMKEEDNNQYSDRVITYAPTTCTLVDRKVFDDIGFHDGKYFVYYDDTDLWFRMFKHGKHKMYYINDVEFYHKLGGSSKTRKGSRQNFKYTPFAVKYSTRNKVYYLKKQKTLLAYGNIAYFWFRVNIRFLLSGKYKRDLKTWSNLAKSFYEGLTL